MTTTRKFQLEVMHDRRVVEQISAFETIEGGIKQRVTKSVERVVPESYMVYFPHGHSIWIESKSELARMGLLPHDNIEIDTETGLPVLPPEMPDFKARSARKTVAAGGKVNG